jgi:copper homeostasis protein
MPKFLEVIVISVEDAIEAEAGGADRLEVVRALELGGLTPDAELVKDVLRKVKLPVRVMLRQTPDMSSGGPGEKRILKSCAESFAALPIDGLVLGFIRDGQPDTTAMLDILSAAPGCRATFHRAFDELADPIASIKELKRLPQVDRILTVGGQGDWPCRKKRLVDWQRAAEPSIGILTGAGLSPAVFSDLANTAELQEIHVGRAARLPPLVTGSVNREAVRSVKSALR